MQEHQVPVWKVAEQCRDRPGDTSSCELELDGDREPFLTGTEERRIDPDGHQRVVAFEELFRSIGSFP